MKAHDLLTEKKLFLFDMDGTLYLGSRLFDFTIELLQAIREAGADYMFITNNSSKSVENYVEKLATMGIAATKDDFFTSSQATAYYLKQHHHGKTLYVCGTEALKKELRSEGFSVSDDITKTQCIVMGFDTELTFQKLYDVSYLLCTKPDLPYIATNPDLVCPTEFGSVPDCGSACIGIRNATGKEPVVIGKPSPLMIQLALAKKGLKPENACVLGDRIYTDIKSAKNAGVTGVLVLSGETTRQILAESDVTPDLILEDAGEILKP